MKQGWLGWAIFLGVSWTWCIGMYLPVLLIRDYGLWAWVAFAIPNVVGAAAMGWMIDADRSRSMVATHRTAVSAFSAVTIAFQIWFGVWAFTKLPSNSSPYLYLLGIVLVAAAATARRTSRLLAAILFLASACCAIGMFRDGEANLNVFDTSQLNSSAPLLLTPIFLFGFLFCPYLDATFHRARQNLAPRDAKRAFGFGFGVIFFAAIILSLFYARPVHESIVSHQSLRWIKVYWMLQLGFTIGVHISGDEIANRTEDGRRGTVVAVTAIAGAAIAMSAGRMLLVPAETIYRCFLGFYGVVFPAYMWLCVLPGYGEIAPPRRAVAVFALSTFIASPLFWLAFIDGRVFWGLPGIGIVLLARLLLANSRRQIGGGARSEFSVQQNSAPTS